MERTRADHMGMLATAINALALADALEKAQCGGAGAERGGDGQNCRADDSGAGHPALGKGAAGYLRMRYGQPVFFPPIRRRLLRAAEINADAILLAKNIDGVYDSDPAVNPGAKKYDKLTYLDVLNQGLKVMDSTATSLSHGQSHFPSGCSPWKTRRISCGSSAGKTIGTIVK